MREENGFRLEWLGHVGGLHCIRDSLAGKVRPRAANGSTTV